jgi:hypothetical protein
VISARMRNIIAGIVTLVWAANFVSGLFVKGYEPDQAINGIFMAIVGGLFVAGARKDKESSSGSPGADDQSETTGGAHRE